MSSARCAAVESVSRWWDVAGAPNATRSRKRRGVPMAKVKRRLVTMASDAEVVLFVRVVFFGFTALETVFGVDGTGFWAVGAVEVLVRRR